MLEYLGSKWNPRIDCIAEVEGDTHLGFDTAWSAPNALLERLHALTGWKIVNRHDEESPDYDAVFTCEDGRSSDERLPGTSTCSNCEDRCSSDDMDDDYGECPTCVKGRDNYLVTIEPDGAAIINTGDKGSADLCGDVVLGVFSARSPKQAMLLSSNEVPAAAKEGWDWYNDPEGFGLRAYKLASTDEEEEG